MLKRLQNRLTASKGQSLAEYGMILALVTVVCIGALQMLGDSTSTMLGNAIATISSAIMNAIGSV